MILSVSRVSLMTEISISGLIGIFSQEKRLIQWLFDHPLGKISLDDTQFLELIRSDKERLSTLLQRKVLILEENFVSLNPYLFLSIYTLLTPGQQPASYTIAELIDRLKKSVAEYEKHSGQKPAYPHFFHILKFTGMLHTALLLFAESVESQTGNPSVNIQAEMEKLNEVCLAVSGLFAENTFLQAAEDRQLKEQIFQISQTVRLIREIVDTAEKQMKAPATPERDFAQKLKQLKYLRDQQLIQQNTNLQEVIDEEKAMVWEEPLTLNPLPEINDSHVANPSGNPELLFSGQAVHPSTPDISKLKETFINSNTDLYHFLAGHPFAETWTDAEKTHLFFKMLSQFFDSFEILPEFIETHDGKFPKIIAKTNF